MTESRIRNTRTPVPGGVQVCPYHLCLQWERSGLQWAGVVLQWVGIGLQGDVDQYFLSVLVTAVQRAGRPNPGLWTWHSRFPGAGVCVAQSHAPSEILTECVRHTQHCGEWWKWPCRHRDSRKQLFPDGTILPTSHSYGRNGQPALGHRCGLPDACAKSLEGRNFPLLPREGVTF